MVLVKYSCLIGGIVGRQFFCTSITFLWYNLSLHQSYGVTPMSHTHFRLHCQAVLKEECPSLFSGDKVPINMTSICLF